MTKAPIQVVAAVIERAGLVLLAQRPPGKHLAGLWEFPGGKIESGETAAGALVREIAEELGTTILVGEALPHVVHAYPNAVIELIPFHCSLAAGAAEPVPREHVALRWLPVSQLHTLSLAAADVPVVEALRAGQ